MNKLLTFGLCALIITSGTSCAGETASQTTSTGTAHAKEPAKQKFGSDFLKAPKNRYQAKFLDGSDFDSYDYQGQKLVLAYFNYNNRSALPLLTYLKDLKQHETSKRFKIIAVSVNAGKKAEIEKFIKDNKIPFPVILEDTALSLATKLNVENEVSLLGLDNEHTLAFGLRRFVAQNHPEAKSRFLAYLKENLLIKELGGTKPYLGIYPKAPQFAARTTTGEMVNLANLKGKVVFLFFFSPRCPHCQKEIAFMKKYFTPEVKKAGLEVLAVSVLKVEGQDAARIKNFKMPAEWKLIDDSSRKIRKLYSQSRTIPEVFYIDKEGRIRFYDGGYGPASQPLITMKLNRLLGLPNPPLVTDKRYNGVQNCMICHEEQYIDWSVTPHAHAWETLELKGDDINVDCAGCHSLGMNDPKGWKPTKLKSGETVAIVPELFQNVQCEHCHGIGGAHVSNPLSKDQLKKSCLECHTEKFSLHFDFDERITHVNHSNKKKILEMSSEERMALLEKVSKSPHQLFGSKMKYVGSDSCLSCHGEIHKNWQGSPHGKAFESLKRDNKTTDPNCLKCHTVGYDQPGGYQEALKEDLKGVGCESCHGPGEMHVKTKSKKDIRGLGDDCPFCVVEQICLSCHDAKNDPHFNIYKGLEEIKGHN